MHGAVKAKFRDFLCSRALDGIASGWRTLCLVERMSIAFKVQKKSGNYIRATLTPANHSDESRFGLLDGAIVTVFLLGVGGLIYLLMLS